MKLLDSVTESNKSLAATIVELKDGMIKIGDANTQIGRDNKSLLETLDRRLEDVEETSKEIEGLLRDLRGGRGQPYAPPANFTETDEST
jgi:methyl-accepting chemotaxis protein